ncbi:MAG: MgtC/SapB family protein [Xanthomarina gelatinilytica]|uniref:MgtC/SapB family protein n=1 Tax=Xanthomarina gelatinilytica TaxID=1137281 RepID=UPI003A8C3838
MMSELFTFEAKEVLDFSIKIGIATISGLLIGLEREYKGKSAGLKTNALVAIGAAGCLAATSMFFELIVLTLLVIIINLVFGYLDLKINKTR